MADVAGIIVEVVVEIHNVATTMRENNRQARRLSERVAAIEPAVVAVQRGRALFSSEALHQLLETLKRIQTFLGRYARSTMISRALNRRANAATFTGFGDALTVWMQAVHLDVAVDAWVTEDASDRLEDLETLIDLVAEMERRRAHDHNEVMGAHATTHAGLTEVLEVLRGDERSELTAWVEIDFENELDFEGSIRLGSGGFGEVRTAKWNESDVAVKHLRADDVDRNLVRALRKEIRVHASLHFDHVVQLYAASTIAPHLCMVLELTSGGSLWQYLHSTTGPLAHPLQTAFLFDIARGMSFLHRKGILHRDLKSANVLVFANHRLKLCDFGLSKIIADSPSLSSGGPVGTIPWMSPEVINGDDATELTDVYSFGVVCFEVTTRTAPFQGMMPAQVMRAVADQGRRPQIPEGASASLDVVRLMERCWKQVPAQRPEGFAPVVQELASVVRRVGDPRSRSSAAPAPPMQDASTDRAVLVGLYNATSGPSWTNGKGWGESVPLGEWYGVTVDGEGRVIKLDLRRNNLTGSIPTALGDLTAVKELLLNNNNLSGSIPTALGQLTAVEWLLLFGNKLSGSIPTALGQLTAVQRLSLSSNNLSGSIPTALGQLTAVQGLYLYNNQLSGRIPAELGELAALKILRVDSNQLSGPIPSALGKLAALERLDLSRNQLTGSIPTALGDLTAVKELYLNGNNLSDSIPTALGQLTAVKELNLNGNQLSGHIPAELGELAALKTLRVNSNQLSGSIPTALGQLTAVKVLCLNDNQLSGSIPTALGQLTAVGTLFLENNNLSGPIPTALGQLTAVELLALNNNKLSGSIPTALGQLTAVEWLTLNNNQLSGSIPTALGQLTAVQWLSLNNNQLSGPIPSTLGKLAALIRLDLSRNQLTGSIPTALGQLTAVVELFLNNNQLSGPIPSTLGKLAALTSLYLSRNQLTGSKEELQRMLPNCCILWL